MKFRCERDTLTEAIATAAKTVAINNQLAMLKTEMGVMGSMNNLNISSLLNFSVQPSV